MQVIAVIEPACAGTADRRPTVVRQILKDLGLPTGAASLRAPPDLPEGPAADHPREWSYEPCLDLPVRRTQTDDLPVPDPVMA